MRRHYRGRITPSSVDGVLVAAILVATIACSERSKPATALPYAPEGGLSPEAGQTAFDATVTSGLPSDDASTDISHDIVADAASGDMLDGGSVQDAQSTADGTSTAEPDRPWACPGERPEPLPRQATGWASVDGYDTPTTVGGLGGAVVSATSEEELRELVADASPRVIGICGTIRLTSRLQIGSNKTLIGLGDGALIRGGLDVFGTPGKYVSNVIIRNLTLDASTVTGLSADALAGIRTEYAHHVWLDHLEVYNAPRGLIDVVFGSDLVTISWSKFYFTEETPDVEHRFGIRVGDVNDDSVFGRDGGRLRVTLHHNWFAEYIRQRSPRVAFGQAHIVNNYYSIVGNDTTIWGASAFALVLVEANYFNGTTNPHEIVLDEMAQLVARDNIYDGTVGLMETNGAVFEPTYSFALDDAADIPALVQWGAGPSGGIGSLPDLDAGVAPPVEPVDSGKPAAGEAGSDAQVEAGLGYDSGADASTGPAADADLTFQ